MRVGCFLLSPVALDHPSPLSLNSGTVLHPLLKRDNIKAHETLCCSRVECLEIRIFDRLQYNVPRPLFEWRRARVRTAQASLGTLADKRFHAASPDDVVIALMGMTGAGKSSFISLCSDQKPSIGHDLNSCTCHGCHPPSTLLTLGQRHTIRRHVPLHLRWPSPKEGLPRRHAGL